MLRKDLLTLFMLISSLFTFAQENIRYFLVKGEYNETDRIIEELENNEVLDYQQLSYGLLNIKIVIDKDPNDSIVVTNDTLDGVDFGRIQVILNEGNGDGSFPEEMVNNNNEGYPYAVFGNHASGNYQDLNSWWYNWFKVDNNGIEQHLSPGKQYRLITNVFDQNSAIALTDTLTFSLMELKMYFVGTDGIPLTGISPSNTESESGPFTGLEGKHILDLDDLDHFTVKAVIRPKNLVNNRVNFELRNTTDPENVIVTNRPPENIAPYALFADDIFGTKEFYDWTDVNPGEHYIIKATPTVLKGEAGQFTGATRTLQFHFKKKDWLPRTFAEPEYKYQVNNIVIENKVFDFDSLNNDSKKRAIRVIDADSVIIRNCVIRNFREGSAAIYMRNVSNVHIDHVYIENVNTGIQIFNTVNEDTFQDREDNDIIIHDVQFKNIYRENFTVLDDTGNEVEQKKGGLAIQLVKIQGRNIKIVNNSLYNDKGVSGDCFNFFGPQGYSDNWIEFYGNVAKGSSQAEFATRQESLTGAFFVIEDGTKYFDAHDNVGVRTSANGIQLEARGGFDERTRSIRLQDNLLYGPRRNNSTDTGILGERGRGQTNVGVQYELNKDDENVASGNRVYWVHYNGIYNPGFSQTTHVPDDIKAANLLSDNTLTDLILSEEPVYFPTAIATPSSGRQTLTLGTNEQEPVLYPVPTSENLLIRLANKDSSQVKVELINKSGNMVLFKESSHPEIAMDISSLPAGYYLVRIHNGEKMIVKRIIIE